ncbi:transglutaminase family protein [uncultured Nevskia sp.]|uniref:transglutaminase-like domain-containing protein n=1 Tax=uncultured Nevskia sp. TaxID=228950 RepID=UPI0025FF2EE5|nr:transglutaminase family protein [uncultured Nevskia sp.]
MNDQASDTLAALAATDFIDADHPMIRAFAAEVIGDLTDPREQAVALYYAVRDRLRYDPYTVDLSDHALKASTTLAAGRGWCQPKATLLAAACRAVGVPARVGFADVKNHLSTERLRQVMQTDTYYWHGYAAILLDSRWVKATPAFNIELCQKFQLQPLEFDGREDSIYHPFDLSGNRHMEYVNLRGDFDDVPITAIREDFARYYPQMMGLDTAANFDADVEAEIATQPRG